MADSNEVNPMLAGKKIIGIFGYCSIKDFANTTEILQEQVLIFVNEIAEITHRITDQFCGSANKNIGDSFLLVWKFMDSMLTKDINKNPQLLKSR